MTKEELFSIKNRLEELYVALDSARRTRDGRKRDKAIRDARNAIHDYSHLYMPSEVLAYLENVVGGNTLNYQHADDIGECICALNNEIKDLENNLTE